MKMTTAETTYNTETCNSYSTSYSSANQGSFSRDGISVRTSSWNTKTADQISFSVTTMTSVSLAAGRKVFCAIPSGPTSTSSHSYEPILKNTTNQYTFPDFTTTVCSGSVFTYTAAFNPTTPAPIVYATPTTTNRLVDWTNAVATDVGTYTVTITGTLPDSRSVTTTFQVIIKNSCTTAITDAPTSATSVSYIIGTATATTSTAGPFTTSFPTGCPISTTYVLAFKGNNTVIGPGHALFSLSGSTLSIGPQSAHSWVGTYNLIVNAVG
jgi:hypothetical protein